MRLTQLACIDCLIINMDRGVDIVHNSSVNAVLLPGRHPTLDKNEILLRSF